MTQTDRDMGELTACRLRIQQSIDNFTIHAHDAYVFYVTYGRYESVAKSQGWVKSKDPKKPLQVCPGKVAAAVGSAFRELLKRDRNLSEAVDYFIRQPPLGQQWGLSGPEWHPITRNSNGLLLTLEHLAQARNNLVHGGKGWQPAECKIRDQEVISNGLTILFGVICCSAELSERFFAFPDV